MDPVTRQPSHVLFPVGAEPDVAAVRRAVGACADRVGAAPERRAVAELAATELATNLLRHAEPGGWMLLRPVPAGEVEMLAVDRGPGIDDLAAALAGRTRAPRGLGCGLASVRRAASVFDVHSEPGRGTTVLAVVDVIGPPASGQARPVRAWGGVSVGITRPCGDGWAVTCAGGTLAVAVVDGLGHGPGASEATDAALEAFAAGGDDVDTFLGRANDALRATRGAAATVCRVDTDAAEVRYLAVGNVNARVLAGGEHRGLVTYSGTLGLRTEPPRAKVRTCAWRPGATLVLWTDGLVSRLALDPDADLLNHDPAVIAATLHRDHTRNRDDATVVVVRGPVEA